MRRQWPLIHVTRPRPSPRCKTCCRSLCRNRSARRPRRSPFWPRRVAPHDLSVAYQVVAIVGAATRGTSPQLSPPRGPRSGTRVGWTTRARPTSSRRWAPRSCYAGRTAEGDRYLREAEALATPDRLPHLQLRRAVIGYVTGRYAAALADASAAIAGCHTLGDDCGRPGLTTRSVIWLAMGDPVSADSDARLAEEVFARWARGWSRRMRSTTAPSPRTQAEISSSPGT